MEKKEYNKIYQHCMYLARKELVVRHQDEYRQILDKVMLDSGIITRRVSKDNKHKFAELCREQVEVTQ
jgi:hypothetical protein